MAVVIAALLVPGLTAVIGQKNAAAPSSGIYRVGILMYGKRPNIPERVRWLRYT